MTTAGSWTLVAVCALASVAMAFALVAGVARAADAWRTRRRREREVAS